MEGWSFGQSPGSSYYLFLLLIILYKLSLQSSPYEGTAPAPLAGMLPEHDPATVLGVVTRRRSRPVP